MMTKEKIDTLGAMFRFVTPILIAIVGFFTVNYLGDISRKFDKIENKFDTFLQSYHIIDKRVDQLEYKVFGAKKYETATTIDQ